MSQPPPMKTDTPEVWPMVSADVRGDAYQMGLNRYDRELLARAMDARNEFGRQKYGIGIGLQAENGRDPLKDASEEALDLSVYTRQQYERTQRSDDWETHRLAVMLAARLQWRMALRDEEVAP